jgi:sulfhydrogenase subunit beta (sulfur reductase)
MADVLVTHYEISLQAWEKAITTLLGKYPVYAPVKRWNSIDYEMLNPENLRDVIYNTPKPVSPLKLFLLPVKENVVLDSDAQKPFVVIGTPACDLWALDLLDLFFLQSDFVDPYYRMRRENMILIGTDCHSTLEHCHCTTYGINPYPEKNQDIVLSVAGESVFLEVHTPKGHSLIEAIGSAVAFEPGKNGLPERIQERRKEVKNQLEHVNKHLPNYQETSNIVRHAKEEVWEKYSKTCVSCGACATICPTCTCFLLIDRPGFEKVKQIDACQYPGFQRVAGGEDPFGKLPLRFRNRYMCKYVFRPEKYDAIACTGCGRCIEACIGKINKNELFLEITQ